MKRRQIKALIFRSTAVFAGCSIIACAETLNLTPPCHAADFSRAKQIYVPPSRIRRRFDFESLREREAPSSWDSGGYGMSGAQFEIPPAMTPVYPGTDSSSSKPAKGGKYGLIPPPPPMTPSLLPSSNFVMPRTNGTTSTSQSQPPAKSPWTAPAQLRATQYKLDQKGAWSKSVSDGLQKLSQSPQLSSVIDRAQGQVEKLMSEGKLQDAEEVIKNYLKSFPKDKQLRTELAQTVSQKAQEFLQSDDCEAALKAARSALSIDASSSTATLVLNEALKKKGANPHSEHDRLKQAELLSSQGKNSEALVEYKAALKIKPTAEGYIGVGNIYMRESKRDLAKIEYEEALQLEPSNWQALRQMGIVRYQTGDLVGANADLSKALTIHPQDTVAAKNLVELWQRQVSKNPRDVNAHMGLARAYQLTNDLKSAQAEYREVVRIDPEHPSLPAARQSFKLALARQEALKSFQAAHTLDSHGAVQEAYQKIVEAVGLAPSDTNIRFYQADLCRRLGYIGQAHDAYMAILKVEPKNELAAQRLKALQALSHPRTSGGAAPPVAPSLAQSRPGGMATNDVMNFVRSPFQQPQQLNAAGTPAALPQQFKPAAPPDPVQNLGGFLSSLRDVTLKEKQRMEKVEDNAHSALNTALGLKGGGGGGSGGSHRSADDLAALLKEETPILETPVLAGATATSATPAAQAAAPAAAPATPPAAGTTDVNSLASLAMQALPALKSGGSKASALAGLAGAAPSLLGNGGKLPMLSGDDMDKVYQMLKGPISTRLGAAPPVAPAAVTAAQNPPVAPSAAAPNTANVPLEGLQVAYQKLGSLEEQNKQLQSQLKQAQDMINALQSSKATTPPPVQTSVVEPHPVQLVRQPQTVQQLQTYPIQNDSSVFNNPPLPISPSFTGSGANDVPPGAVQSEGATSPASQAIPSEAPVSPDPLPAPPATRSVAPAEPPAAPSLRRADLQTPPSGEPSGSVRPARHLFGPAMPPTNQLQGPSSKAPPQGGAAANGTVSSIGNATAIANAASQSITLPMAPRQAVRFELQGVSGSLTETKLKVVLRNDSDVVLKLPGDARVLVRLPGQAEKQMKVLFDGKEIAPRGEIKGTIKVQRKDLNPSADVYLPDILPASDGERGVHLTVPISSL